jgi:fructose-specific phosphotransferase system IIC component
LSKINHDRYTIGFIAGIIAGFVADLSNFLLTKVFKIGKVGYQDFAAVLVYGKIARTTGEILFAHFVQLFFSALLGATFAFWIQRVSERFLIFKGISFGLFVWFFAFSVCQLYKLQNLNEFDLMTVIVDNIAAVIYGVLLGIALRWLYRKLEIPETKEYV